MPDFTQLTDHLAHRPLLGVGLAWLGGVLTSFTPCLYPMIPVTAAIVGGQTLDAAGPPPRGRTVFLTFAYVLGLALTYAGLGLAAALGGSLFGGVSTDPRLQLLQANLLLLFALMLLDVVAVPIPSRWLTRAATLEPRGRALGAFAMGGASGLVAAPCGAPVLATLLTFVAASGRGALGFAALFAFSLGMCTLLLVVGLVVGGVGRLPRPGRWMVWVKRGFAVALLAMAQYYLIRMGQVL